MCCCLLFHCLHRFQRRSHRVLCRVRREQKNPDQAGIVNQGNNETPLRYPPRAKYQKLPSESGLRSQFQDGFTPKDLYSKEIQESLYRRKKPMIQKVRNRGRTAPSSLGLFLHKIINSVSPYVEAYLRFLCSYSIFSSRFS